MNTPRPGIYSGIPFELYLEWPAVNNSSLSAMLRSPAHYFASLTDRSEPSPAQRLGTLTHVLGVEPLKALGLYVVMPDFSKQVHNRDGSTPANPKATKEYKDLVAEFQAANSDKSIVTHDEYDRAVGMIQSIHANERAREYVSSCAEPEQSIVWIDSLTGLTCKARIDAASRVNKRLTDLKTSRDVTNFSWSIFNYEYHRQAAFYLDGYKTLTGMECEFCLVVAESDKPYTVLAAPVGPASIRAGRERYQAALKRIVACHENGNWPALANPDAWDLPESKLPPITLSFDGQPLSVGAMQCRTSTPTSTTHTSRPAT